jgi:hypothetical protein
MPKQDSASALSIAEIRLQIEGRSAPTHTLTIRGRTRPNYHFYRERETGIYHRRYVLGKTDPENGIFPLEIARTDMDDIQRSATRLGGFKVIIVFLTSEELAAKDAAKAADLEQREADAQAELEREARAARLAAPEAPAPAEPPQAAPSAPKAKKSAKPAGLAKLDALVGASA